jgi:DNA-binding HxlR family transcriptional regulator
VRYPPTVPTMVKKKESTESSANLIDIELMLDETCNRILRALLEDKPLRFSEIQSYVTKLYGVKEPTNRVLSKHLKHLQERNLIKRTELDPQTVEYSLSDAYRKITQLPKEELLSYLDATRDEQTLIPKFRTKRLDKKEYYSDLTKDQLDTETDKDLHDVLSLNLWEFKLSIENSLQLREGESDEAFWTFFANPTYRMHEKEAAEKCRNNAEYKEALFKKLDLLIEQLRSDRELFRKRRDRQAKTKSEVR